MYYQSAGRLETDQSVYAIQEGLIGRYGVLDPTDGMAARRAGACRAITAPPAMAGCSRPTSMTSTHHEPANNFTHFLLDPVNGDQEQQDETRDVYGG
jgi:hypothetical protein